MTPKILKAYVEADALKRKRENTSQWQHNAYTFRAILTALDQGFNGKKSKLEYPEKPFSLDNSDSEASAYISDSKKIENEREYTDDEMKKVNLLFASLDTMKANWDLEHNKVDTGS